MARKSQKKNCDKKKYPDNYQQFPKYFLFTTSYCTSKGEKTSKE